MVRKRKIIYGKKDIGEKRWKDRLSTGKKDLQIEKWRLIKWVNLDKKKWVNKKNNNRKQASCTSQQIANH